MNKKNRTHVLNLLLGFSQYDPVIAKVGATTFRTTEELRSGLRNSPSEGELWILASQFIGVAYQNSARRLALKLEVILPPGLRLSQWCWEDLVPRLRREIPEKLFELLAMSLRYWLTFPASLLEGFPEVAGLRFWEPGVLDSVPEVLGSVRFEAFMREVVLKEGSQDLHLSHLKALMARRLAVLFRSVGQGQDYDTIFEGLMQTRLADVRGRYCQAEVVLLIEKRISLLPMIPKKLLAGNPFLAGSVTDFWEGALQNSRSFLVRLLRQLRIPQNKEKVFISDEHRAQPFRPILEYVKFHVDDVYPALSAAVTKVYNKVSRGTDLPLSKSEVDDILRIYSLMQITRADLEGVDVPELFWEI